MHATEDAARIEAMVGENARREVAGLAHLADGEYRLIAIEFIEAAPQFGKRNVFRAWHRLFGGACGGTNVDHLWACTCKVGHGNQQTIADVACGKASDVDDILRAAEGRRVGKLEVSEIIDLESSSNRGGNDVETLVHTSFAVRLRAQDSSILKRPEELESDGFGARVIACMRGSIDRDGLIGNGFGFEPAFRIADNARAFLKHANDGGADASRITQGLIAEENVIGGGASLAVGGTAERRGEYAEQNPENVAKFLAVYLRAWSWMKAHQPEAIAMMQKFYAQGGVNISEASMKKEFTTRPTFDLKEQLERMDRARGNSDVDTWFGQIAVFMRGTGSIQSVPASADYVSDVYMKRVQADPKLRAFANRTN